MNKAVSLILLFLLFGCNQTTKIKGAIWSGSSDFMYITNESMEMFYASSISTKEVFIDGTYEILKDGTNDIINTINVVNIEFLTHVDGSSMCRVWGKVEGTEKLSYILANDCKPL